MIKIHPSVEAAIKPIVYDMTRIDIAQMTNPVIGAHNESEMVKELKKSCVHITYDGSEYRLRVEKTPEGKLVCRACGREINIKFDDSAVKTLMDAIAVVNQILLFGMLNGLKAEPVLSLISLKKTLPAAAQLMRDMNEYVKRDDQNREAELNIGSEYFNGSFKSITGM